MKDKYAEAGVNIDANEQSVKIIARHVRSTYGPEVLGDTGFFGGLYEFKGYERPVLVSSVDGVGTKLKIAIALEKHDTVGMDIVNHCVNDIFAGGARPLFFLDYIGTGKLLPEQIEQIIKGMAEACREVGCALIGGEMAEMPDVYGRNDYDLVGCIVGVVDKEKIINGSTITAGDAVIGLPSSGLHTNGYTLVRRLLGETRDRLDVHYPELGRTLGEELLEPHRCYFNVLSPHLSRVKGMAHITGGGLIENVPRILPEGLAAHFQKDMWTVPPVFELIRRRGDIEDRDMYRTFNMGVGMVAVCSPENAAGLLEALPGAGAIGEITKQDGGARVVIA